MSSIFPLILRFFECDPQQPPATPEHLLRSIQTHRGKRWMMVSWILVWLRRYGFSDSSSTSPTSTPAGRSRGRPRGRPRGSLTVRGRRRLHSSGGRGRGQYTGMENTMSSWAVLSSMVGIPSTFIELIELWSKAIKMFYITNQYDERFQNCHYYNPSIQSDIHYENANSRFSIVPAFHRIMMYRRFPNIFAMPQPKCSTLLPLMLASQ